MNIMLFMYRKGVDVMYRVKRFWDTNIDEYEYFIQNIKNKEIIAVTSNKDDANKIVKALGKQIPKKPLFKTDYSAYEYYYACPSCGALVAEHMNYCSGNRDYGEPSERGCGQELDWGD